MSGESGAIPSLNDLLWISIKPMFRIVIPGGIGFTLSKTGIFPPTGPRITSMLIINCTLPALLISKIVPSFNSSNISALGPIILTAFFYVGFNFVSGVIVRSLFGSPRKFRYGILCAFTFSNWGDLPTAVSQAVTSSAPFAGAADEALAIAYIAIFILVNYIVLFPLQGIRLVAMDYTSPVTREKELVYEESGGWRTMLGRVRRGKPMRIDVDDYVDEKKKDDENYIDASAETHEVRLTASHAQSITTLPDQRTHATLTPTPSFAEHPSSHPLPSASTRAWLSIKSFLKSLVSPPTIALLSALVIALVPPLKALFVAPTDGSWHPTGPDGLPPLSFLYDIANFMGAASVPLGLMVLGASMAKLEIPRPISRLPLASIAATAVVKMGVLPVVGFFFVHGLTKRGMVDKDNKVLRFVLTYFSCVPTATTQIAYTQIFGPANGDNNADLLSAYLIAQYTVYTVSSVVLTALTLTNIF